VRLAGSVDGTAVGSQRVYSCESVVDDSSFHTIGGSSMNEVR
jgi:hypothetical protein